MLSGFVGPLSGNAVLALLPTLSEVFHVSATTILISIPVFMLPFAAIQIFSGALSDINRRGAFFFGFSSYSIGAIICAFSTNFELFLSGRFVQGIGFAFVNPVITAILGDIVPTKSRGSAMGVLGASTTAGIALGPLVAGTVAIIDWRLAFFIFASLGIVVIVLFSISFAGFEFKGSFALKDVGKKLLETAKNRNVEYLMLCGFITFFSYIGAISFISAELSSLGFTDASIGVIISSAGIAGIISSPIAGRIADFLGRRAAAVIGYSIVAITLFILSISDRNIFELDIVLFFILGIGTAHIWSSLLTLSVEVIPEMRGTSTSLFNSARFFGYASAPLFLSPIFEKFGMSTVALVASLSAIFSGLVVVFLVRESKTEKNK